MPCRFSPPDACPPDHRYSSMLVQSYIHTGFAISIIRVLTLFGGPLYALQNWNKIETIELAPEKVRTQNPIIAHQSSAPGQKGVKLNNDENVLALARTCFAACPEGCTASLRHLAQFKKPASSPSWSSIPAATHGISLQHARRVQTKPLAAGAVWRAARKFQFNAL
jgi:hypothetical protein